MKFVQEFRNKDLAKKLVKNLQRFNQREIRIMEVCGTHTMSIFHQGIRSILPENIKLISGPGCPVCVTPQSYIDTAIELSKRDDVITTTFGDMMRVPGKEGSLFKRKAEGADIRMVYSSMDALNIAKENPSKKVVFLSVGFETTTPITAISILEAKEKNIKNISFLTAQKAVAPALKLLAEDEELNIDGFLLPGHVSAVIGVKPYEFLSRQYSIPAVVTGFESLDILQGLCSLLTMIENKNPELANEYKRVVSENGNLKAKEYIEKVFEPSDSNWRGMGMLASSGYKIREEYKEFDALNSFNIDYKEYDGSTGCRCGEVLKGKITPKQCPLFGKVCTPEDPIGSCMVSGEGTCAAYYKYDI